MIIEGRGNNVLNHLKAAPDLIDLKNNMILMISKGFFEDN